MPDFERSLPMMLHRTLDAVMPAYRELFKRHNLTEQQWRILRVLWEHEKVSSAELSARALLPAPSLVGILDRLEAKGLVSRLRSVEDRRVTFVVASARGRTLQTQVLPEVDAIHARLRAAVSAKEWNAMEDTLLRINAAVQNEDTTDEAAAN